MREEHDFIRRVEDLHGDPAFHEVLNRLEESWTNKWKSAATTEEREATWALVAALGAIWVEIESISNHKKFVAFNTRRTLRAAKI